MQYILYRYLASVRVCKRELGLTCRKCLWHAKTIDRCRVFRSVGKGSTVAELVAGVDGMNGAAGSGPFALFSVGSMFW